MECADVELLGLLRAFEWKQLFWEKRDAVLARMRVVVLGHAVMEKAMEPWPGITCKAIVVPHAADVDALACDWLGALQTGASPRDLAPVPVFGYPGWCAQDAALYDDARYFRPRPVKCHRESARQPLHASAEESPGSAERDAG